MSRNPHFSLNRFIGPSIAPSFHAASDLDANRSLKPKPGDLILVDCVSCGNTVCIQSGERKLCGDCLKIDDRKAAEMADAFRPMADAAQRIIDKINRR